MKNKDEAIGNIFLAALAGNSDCQIAREMSNRLGERLKKEDRNYFKYSELKEIKDEIFSGKA